MDDFIFGSLATAELRRERVRSLRAGITHNFQRNPIDPLPAQPITIYLTAGPAHTSDRAWVYWTTDGSDPEGKFGTASQGHATPMQLNRTEWDTDLWGYISHLSAVLPGQPEGTLVRYRIGLEMAGGETFADGGKYYALFVADDPLPDWSRDAVVYQIFVDRFYPGEGQAWNQPETPGGIYGGKITGIIEKIPYLHDLGINTIWLTPVFPSPTHHGYDTTDFFDIEPRLGNKDDLHNLIREAHHHGMRILLDFVPNHVSDQHPAFQDACKHANSAYRQWFTFTEWPREYETFFGVRSLPQINLRNPAARKHVLDAARYWLEAGVDGYRVDYALGPSPDFWADFRQVTREVNPDCWTFGEIVDPSDVQLTYAGQLDGALDFILLEGLRQTAAFGRWDAARLASFLDRHEKFFPPDFSRPSFLDNHDMNRFLWAAGNDLRRLRLAALCQFTLSGPPVVYYGTEVGLSQQRDVRQGSFGIPEESRLPMLWGDDQNTHLLNFYRQLIQLRSGEPALRRGIRTTITAAKNLLVYTKDHEGDHLTVVLNLGLERTEAKLPYKVQHLLATEANVSIEEDESGANIILSPLSGLVVRNQE